MPLRKRYAAVEMSAPEWRVVESPGLLDAIQSLHEHGIDGLRRRRRPVSQAALARRARPGRFEVQEIFLAGAAFLDGARSVLRGSRRQHEFRLKCRSELGGGPVAQGSETR